MARYRIRYWKSSRLWCGRRTSTGRRRPSCRRAFRTPSTGRRWSARTSEEAYLEGWTWGPVKELPGTADRVVNLIVAKLDMEYPDERREWSAHTGASATDSLLRGVTLPAACDTIFRTIRRAA